MKRLWYLLAIVLLLASGVSPAAPLDARPCKAITVPVNPGMLLPLATHPVDNTTRALQATDKAYTQSSHHCFRITNTTDQLQELDFYLQNPRLLHAEFLQASDSQVV